MGLESFRTPGTDWLEQLDTRAENLGFSIYSDSVASNSNHFKIEGDGICAIGKTHHTKKSKRTESYINLNSAYEANWREQPEKIPSDLRGSKDIVDIFGIVVDHRSPNGYQPEQDKFLILTEDILKEIPESGNKPIRITSSGYRDPFDEHIDRWERIFIHLR